MSEISNRLKTAIKESGLSHRELEVKTGIPHSAIQRYAAGTTDRIPIGRLEILAKALGTTAEYILGWENTKNPDTNIFTPKMKKIPLLGKTACGEPIYSPNYDDGFTLIGEGFDVDFALEAKGDSMIGAGIYDGDIVYFKEQPIVDNGQIAAVFVDNEVTLKRVYYYGEKNKIILQPENSKYEPMIYMGAELDSIRIIGKAVAHLRKL